MLLSMHMYRVNPTQTDIPTRVQRDNTVITQTGLLHIITPPPTPPPPVAPQTNPKSHTDAQTDCDATQWHPESRAQTHCPMINNGTLKLIKWLQSYSSQKCCFLVRRYCCLKKKEVVEFVLEVALVGATGMSKEFHQTSKETA